MRCCPTPDTVRQPKQPKGQDWTDGLQRAVGGGTVEFKLSDGSSRDREMTQATLAAVCDHVRTAPLKVSSLHSLLFPSCNCSSFVSPPRLCRSCMRGWICGCVFGRGGGPPFSSVAVSASPLVTAHQGLGDSGGRAVDRFSRRHDAGRHFFAFFSTTGLPFVRLRGGTLNHCGPAEAIGRVMPGCRTQTRRESERDVQFVCARLLFALPFSLPTETQPGNRLQCGTGSAAASSTYSWGPASTRPLADQRN